MMIEDGSKMSEQWKDLNEAGLAAFKARNYEQAKLLFTTAAQGMPREVSPAECERLVPLVNLGTVLLKLGQRAKAAAALTLLRRALGAAIHNAYADARVDATRAWGATAQDWFVTAGYLRGAERLYWDLPAIPKREKTMTFIESSLDVIKDMVEHVAGYEAHRKLA